jgi:hypothetical protein
VEPDVAPAETEAPGARWRRFAAERRARLQPPDAVSSAARWLASRHRVGRAGLGEIRERVRAYGGQGPPRSRVLGAASPQPDDGDREPPQPAPPVVLDPQLQQHLERFLRLRLPPIHIHTTAAADGLARRVGADAVTARDAVFFRRGAFQPTEPAGVALLAHEATHVAWAHGARPAGPSPREERTALTNEQRYLARRESVPLVPPPAAPAGNPAAPMAAPPPAFVQTAMASRDIDDAGMTPSQGAQLSEASLRALKADVYRMVLDKLRSEFERGA